MPTLQEEMLEAVNEAAAAAPAEPVEEPATEENSLPEEETSVDNEDSTSNNEDEPNELAEIAERYGVDVETLKQFSTPKDAENALALRDLEQFKQFPQQDVATTSPDSSTVPLDDEFPELDLGELDKDDPVAKVLKAQHDKAHKAWLKAKEATEHVASYQRYQQEQQAQQLLAHANSVLDKLGSDRYGDSSKSLSAVQQRNRAKTLRDSMLFAAAKQNAGERVDLDKLILRTDRAEFAVQIAKEQAKKKQAAVEQRAGHKLGSTSRAPSDTPASGKAYTGPLKNDPVFMRLAKQAVGRR